MPRHCPSILSQQLGFANPSACHELCQPPRPTKLLKGLPPAGMVLPDAHKNCVARSPQRAATLDPVSRVEHRYYIPIPSRFEASDQLSCPFDSENTGDFRSRHSTGTRIVFRRGCEALHLLFALRRGNAIFDEGPASWLAVAKLYNMFQQQKRSQDSGSFDLNPG